MNYVKRLIRRIFTRQKKDDTPVIPSLKKENNNPFLPQIREIMEQILSIRNIPYERFIPILIDGADSKATLLSAERLGKDLNRILIFTDRPEYFEEYADNMYEEQGLIAEIFLKSRDKMEEVAKKDFYGNVILDFEEKEKKSLAEMFGNKVYIPIFKRQWEWTENLDIAVPIGYNTMTVKGSKTKEQRRCLDKFERAFYENE